MTLDEESNSEVALCIGVGRYYKYNVILGMDGVSNNCASGTLISRAYSTDWVCGNC